MVGFGISDIQPSVYTRRVFVFLSSCRIIFPPYSTRNTYTIVARSIRICLYLVRDALAVASCHAALSMAGVVQSDKLPSHGTILNM
jgi:hypothetical protein